MQRDCIQNGRTLREKMDLPEPPTLSRIKRVSGIVSASLMLAAVAITTRFTSKRAFDSHPKGLTLAGIRITQKYGSTRFCV